MNKNNLANKLIVITCLLFIILLSLLIAFTMGVAAFRHINIGGDKIPKAIQPIVVKLAEVPSLIKQAAVELRDEITDNPSPLLIPMDKVMRPDWEHKFPNPDDDGYLLLSGLISQENQPIVQLIRVSDGQVLAKWIPDWRLIHHKTSDHRFAPKGNLRSYRAIHPLLLQDGSIIFNTGGSLVRFPLCSSEPSWILDYPHHHSIELSPTGNSIWVPSVTENFTTENSILKEKLRDDSLAEVDLEGNVIRNISFSKVLAENGMTAHMLGNTNKMATDPLHINQITPALSDGTYWQSGDLLVSARNTSTVYLLRPSTGRIIWYQQGPWINQHSAQFLGDHTIAVFGNNVYGFKLSSPFIYQEKHNQIYLHDFKTASTKKPFSDSLNNIKPTTITEGRSKVMEDGSLFVEETNNARLFKLNPSGQLTWSYINVYDKNHLGSISWSRYYTKKEFQIMGNFSKKKC